MLHLLLRNLFLRYRRNGLRTTRCSTLITVSPSNSPHSRASHFLPRCFVDDSDEILTFSCTSCLAFAHTAFIDKAFRDWELRSSANVFSGDNLARAMTPWATTGNTAQTSLAACVVYQNTNAANRVTPSPSKSSDPAGYQKAVNEANKAKKDAAAAAILLGATPEQAEAAKRALEAINKEMGLDLADAQ
jgi:hypothetical protein